MPNPNPTNLVTVSLVTVMAEAAQQAALTAIDEMVNERCTDICARREAGTIDLDMFLAKMREVREARNRVKATIVPQWWDGRFTDGREP
jgi:hypothetical protein